MFVDVLAVVLPDAGLPETDASDDVSAEEIDPTLVTDEVGFSPFLRIARARSPAERSRGLKTVSMPQRQ